MVSGEVDFVLYCITDTLRSFQNFVIETLTATDNVESVRTSLTIRQSKGEPRVPIEAPEDAGDTPRLETV